MNENNLVPIPTQKKEIKRLKRKPHFLGKFIFYVVLVCIGYFAYVNFDTIKMYIKDFSDNTQNSLNSDISTDDINTDTHTTDTDNITSDDIENDLTPEGAYLINSAEASFTEINNESGLNIDVDLSCEVIPKFSECFEKFGKDAPIILVIHSACNESYSNGKYYSTEDSFYSTNDNVQDVGKIICKTLNDNYVSTIHIDDIFGSGAIYNSRKELENAINQTLKTYPSIKVVLDVSRGININEDLSMDKMTTEINGQNVAQISLTVGSDTENETIYSKNLNLATTLISGNNNLIYDITVAPFKLSQDIEPLFLKVDFGTYANTIEEALASGKEFALLLFDVLS